MEKELAQQASFRDAMRRLAATVAVISAGKDGRRHGMTATAVTSLSMEPPSILVCVNRSGSFHALMSESEHFCVNLLRSEQVSISNAFAGKTPAEERFRHGHWEDDEHGVPYLVDAQASILCTKMKAIDYGSHSIFIGLARSVLHSEEICPLIFSNGEYSRCAPLSMAL